MRRPYALAFCSSLLLPALTSALAADVVTLGSSKDNTLYQAPNTALSNALGGHMFVGQTNQASTENTRRAVLEFDFDGTVPPGSIVNQVTLELFMSKTSSGPSTVSMHRVSLEWGEGTSQASGNEGAGDLATTGDVTWKFAEFPTVTWFNSGGDFVAAPSASTIVDLETFYSWTGAGLVSDVQAWVDDANQNHGWILIGDETTLPTSKRFDTRNYVDPIRRPALTIDFTPPGNVGACCLGGTCSLRTQAECASLSGSYLGDGTNCSNDPCGVSGGCCLPSGSCIVASQASCLAQGGAYQGDGTDCIGVQCPLNLEPFVDALPIPAVAQPISGAPGAAAHYEIAITEFDQQLHRDLPPTRLWGYDGVYPGPTIEAWRDAQVQVTWINDLREPSGALRSSHYLPVDTCLHGPDHHGETARLVTHLHGGHVPALWDGYPEFTILPGQQHDHFYPNNQLPATLWYHDHALGITRLNVMMGLAGFYIVRDQTELDLDLPSGAFEVPLVIQDRSFNADGSLQYPALWQEHFFGDTNLVNGMVWPYLEVFPAKYRLRVLNGSNSRTYRLAFDNDLDFQQIGSDGGLLSAPVTVSELLLSPAERADVVVDFGGLVAGSQFQLTNSAPAPYPSGGMNVVPDVMQFRVQPGSVPSDPVPASLRPVDPLLETAAVQEREFVLRKLQGHPCTGFEWLINDLGWDDITEFPVLDTNEVWSFVNPTGIMHPMHMHLVMFQVLDRQDFVMQSGQVVLVGSPQPPPPHEAGWKDTVRAEPNQVTRVIARFEDYEGLFAYHCHVLEHEDHEMMRQFDAVRGPGTAFCYGEVCPCGNDNPQAGCGNSSGSAGVLYSTGSASASADDLVFHMANLPADAFGITFMGGQPIAAVPMGDGLRCVGVPLWRFPIVQADSTGNTALGPGLVAFSGSLVPPAQILSGSTWAFQHWYRDPVGPCISAYNVTNALSVTFTP